MGQKSSQVEWSAELCVEGQRELCLFDSTGASREES